LINSPTSCGMRPVRPAFVSALTMAAHVLFNSHWPTRGLSGEGEALRMGVELGSVALGGGGVPTEVGEFELHPAAAIPSARTARTKRPLINPLRKPRARDPPLLAFTLWTA
jgi:hypothetical protein